MSSSSSPVSSFLFFLMSFPSSPDHKPGSPPPPPTDVLNFLRIFKNIYFFFNFVFIFCACDLIWIIFSGRVSRAGSEVKGEEHVKKTSQCEKDVKLRSYEKRKTQIKRQISMKTMFFLEKQSGKVIFILYVWHFFPFCQFILFI